MDANITNKLRRQIYKRDGWRCALCDSTDGLQIHHVMPRGMGGKSTPQNLITLCWRCHAMAHGLDVLAIDDPEIFFSYYNSQQDEIAEYLCGFYPDWPKGCYDLCKPFEE